MIKAMKRLSTIILSMFCAATVIAQDINSVKNFTKEEKVNKAMNVLGNKSQNANTLNSDFSAWVQDSIETIADSTVYFERPDGWAPVSGFLISYFLNSSVPLSPSVVNNDSAARLTIADSGFGTDLATIVPASNARALSFTGKYKFNGSPEMALFETYATKYDATLDSTIVIGYGSVMFDQNTNDQFVDFSTDIYYFDETTMPDTFVVFATYLEGAIGSELVVDDLKLSYTLTGISNEKNQNVSVYPNPTNESIQIKLNSDVTLNKASVNISSIDGRLVKSFEVSNLNEKLDVSDLNNGIYLLQIKSASESFTGKFIKK